MPRTVQHWLLIPVREKLTKIDAKLIRYAKLATLQMAEVAVARGSFGAILEWIQWFGVPPPIGEDG